MARLLIIVALGFVIWLLVRGFLRRQDVSQSGAAPARSAIGEDMVSCARCGVNMPRSEARMDGSSFVCRDNPRCIESTGVGPHGDRI